MTAQHPVLAPRRAGQPAAAVAVLQVLHPELWWVARRTDLPWLRDPADGRHDDQAAVDWSGIGAVVTQACELVWNGDEGDALEVELPWPERSEEARIVRSWFTVEPPTFDIWSRDVPDDGRHRLWNVWEVCPDLPLPMRSSTLADLEDGHTLPPAVPSPAVSRTVRYNLRTLKSDVMHQNPRHMAALEQLAASSVSWRKKDGSVRRLLVRPSDAPERPWGVRLTATLDDLLDQDDVDAWVNPWNRNFVRPRWLLRAGGVSGQLKELTGPAPWRDLARYGVLPVGSAVLTGAGELSDDLLLVHAVGLNARWRASEDTVRAATLSAVEAAWQAGARSLAMPLIGAGHGGLSGSQSHLTLLQTLDPYENKRGEADVIDVRIIINDDATW